MPMRMGTEDSLLLNQPQSSVPTTEEPITGIDDVYQCAHTIPEAAAAFDKYHQEGLNASILDDSMVILEKILVSQFPRKSRFKFWLCGLTTARSPDYRLAI